MDQPPLREWLDAALSAAHEAGAAIMAIYATDFEVAAKADASPVTRADECAEAIIGAALRVLTPTLPVVAEEAASRGQGPSQAATAAAGAGLWLVDPLDGTREFVARNGEFTVNIALVQAGAPVLGVVHAPALGVSWFGGQGLGAWREDRAAAQDAAGPGEWRTRAARAARSALAAARRPIRCRPWPDTGLALACSRSHGDDAALVQWLAVQVPPLQIASRVAAGSALKFGLLAEGQADVYPRFGRTMEWDTAAGHAVLRAAGGRLLTLDGTELRYGKAGFENPAFVAWGLVPEADAAVGAGARSG